MSVLALASPLVGLLGLVLAVAGASSSHFGGLSPLAGFVVAVFGCFLCAVLALLFGMVGWVRTRRTAHRSGAAQAWAGMLLGAGQLALLALLSPTSEVPAIHDLTTDLDDPPQFVAIAALDAHRGQQLAYPQGAADTPDQQRRAYPELAPIELDQPVAVTLERARLTARAMGWRIVGLSPPAGASEESSDSLQTDDPQDAKPSTAPADPDPDDPAAPDPGSGGSARLEATATSRLFGFVDDVVVRIRPLNGGARVDVRSTSRVGRSDLGANAERILAFSDRLRD